MFVAGVGGRFLVFIHWCRQRRSGFDRLFSIIGNHDVVEKLIIVNAFENSAGVRSFGEIDARPPSQSIQFLAIVASDLSGIVASLNRQLTGRQLPYTLISSVDPFTGDGLIDFMPTNVSKAYALNWWTTHCKIERESIIFAGDSGNDLAAFQAGYLAIVVGNAEQSIKDEVDQKYRADQASDRLCIADHSATSGVLEGCRRFGMLPPK